MHTLRESARHYDSAASGEAPELASVNRAGAWRAGRSKRDEITEGGAHEGVVLLDPYGVFQVLRPIDLLDWAAATRVKDTVSP